MMDVNKKHYYFSLEEKEKIEEAYFAEYQSKYEFEQTMKAVWDANFNLYNETENILKKIEDRDCTMYPLYRHLGTDDEDYEFETREEALREYEKHIGQCLADRLYDL